MLERETAFGQTAMLRFHSEHAQLQPLAKHRGQPVLTTPLDSHLLVQLNERQGVQRLHLGRFDEASGARTDRLTLQHNLLCSHRSNRHREATSDMSTCKGRITYSMWQR